MKIIEGRITSNFGTRVDPLSGKEKIHYGTDIAAPIGTPIYSPTDGVITEVFNHPTGGLTLIIRSECGRIRYGMCHLSATIVHPGDEVKQGEPIAKSGNSGRSTGAHLHYSVKTGGKWHGTQYIGGKFVDSAEFIKF